MELHFKMQFERYEEKGDSVNVVFANGQLKEFDLVIGGKYTKRPSTQIYNNLYIQRTEPTLQSESNLLAMH